MSKRTSVIVGLMFAVLGAGGCSRPSSFGGYLENRRRDLIDVAHVDFSMVNIGAAAYIGPLIIGIDSMTGTKAQEPASSLQIGLGGPRSVEQKGLMVGVVVPMSRQEVLHGQVKKPVPSGFSIGLSAGAVVGIGVEANVLAIGEFVLGLLCIDLAADDKAISK